jgi:pyruvate/2-oxoglutarate/acetoin dehydrogenase E1 component
MAHVARHAADRLAAAGIMQRSGEHLLAAVDRVASADVAVPFTPVLEDAYRPDVARIVEAARAVIRA